VEVVEVMRGFCGGRCEVGVYEGDEELRGICVEGHLLRVSSLSLPLCS
jgi:hypothetical protein